MEKGYIKVRRCTIVINATKGKKVINATKGKKVGVQYYFYEAEIKEIYYTSHPEIKLEQIPAEYTKDYFYHVGDILKSKKGKVFYKTTDKISGDL